MDTTQFQNSIQKGVCLVDFNAEWCGPCKLQKPIIRDVTERFKDKVSVLFINIDENRQLATDFMIQSIPTLSIFKDGNEIERLIGLQTKKTLENKLSAIL